MIILLIVADIPRSIKRQNKFPQETKEPEEWGTGKNNIFLLTKETKLPLKENSLLDLVGLETLLKQVFLPSVNIF